MVWPKREAARSDISSRWSRSDGAMRRPYWRPNATAQGVRNAGRAMLAARFDSEPRSLGAHGTRDVARALLHHHRR